MKSSALLSAVLLFTLSTTALAQKVATWKGGTPGRNWDEGLILMGASPDSLVFTSNINLGIRMLRHSF